MDEPISTITLRDLPMRFPGTRQVWTLNSGRLKFEEFFLGFKSSWYVVGLEWFRPAPRRYWRMRKAGMLIGLLFVAPYFMFLWPQTFPYYDSKMTLVFASIGALFASYHACTPKWYVEFEGDKHRPVKLRCQWWERKRLADFSARVNEEIIKRRQALELPAGPLAISG